MGRGGRKRVGEGGRGNSGESKMGTNSAPRRQRHVGVGV